MQCDCSMNPSMSVFQPPQEQPGVMSLRTQSTDIFTQLCSLPSMTMSQDVSNVLHWGGGGQRVCVCVCVRGLKRRLRARCCEGHTYVQAQQTSLQSCAPTPVPLPPPPPRTVSTPKILVKTNCWWFHHTPSPLTLSLCHSILITLIKSFVHLEISDDNLFHSTLQQWWLWREEN